MLAWSMRARAWRSASKRAMTCRESMPALMSLTATSRLTGCVCWPIQTVPMPPSPICSKSLYGPMTVPGRSAMGPSMVGPTPSPPTPLHPGGARSFAAAVGVGGLEPRVAVRIRPAVFGGCQRNAESVGGLRGCQADEKPQLDDRRGSGIGLFQLLQRVAEGQDVQFGPGHGRVDFRK